MKSFSSYQRQAYVVASLVLVALFAGIQFFVHSDTGSNITISRSPHLRLRALQVVPPAQCDASCCAEYYPSIGQKCSESAESPESSNPFSGIPFAVQIIMIVIFTCLSALFAGLTLGYMSLDLTGLEIVMEGDDPVNANYARRIYPIRKNGNLLLTTLLLGNVAINSILSIMLADKAGGLVGFLASTFLILIFGEIVPQSICSRYPLRIGSASVPLVRIIIVLFFPVAYPLAWILNLVLGEELATTYSNSEMLKLLQIHVKEKIIDADTAIAMTGALKYRNIAVKDVMTPIENTYMLSVDERLNFETLAKIFQSGYSRIPVYEVNKNNVVGLLFTKDLIFVDHENSIRLSDFIEIFGRSLHVVWLDDKLGDVLRELKKGRSHMALVRDVNNEVKECDPFYELKGIITLEDIIEEILGDEIVDETDAFINSTQETKVDRTETFRWARLRLLDAKLVDAHLSFDEARAVTAHLRKNYADVFTLLTDNQLQRLFGETPVTTLPTADHELGKELPNDLLYEKGKPTEYCTLIIAGKVTVLVGDDKFRTDVSSWSFLGAGALENSVYKPDFTAFVSAGPCRCIRVSRDKFAAAVDASALERQTQSNPSSLKDLDSAKSRHLPIRHSSSYLSADTKDSSPLAEATEMNFKRSKFWTALQAVGLLSSSALSQANTGDNETTEITSVPDDPTAGQIAASSIGGGIFKETNGQEINQEFSSVKDNKASSS